MVQMIVPYELVFEKTVINFNDFRHYGLAFLTSLSTHRSTQGECGCHAARLSNYKYHIVQ